VRETRLTPEITKKKFIFLRISEVSITQKAFSLKRMQYEIQKEIGLRHKDRKERDTEWIM